MKTSTVYKELSAKYTEHLETQRKEDLSVNLEEIKKKISKCQGHIHRLSCKTNRDWATQEQMNIANQRLTALIQIKTNIKQEIYRRWEEDSVSSDEDNTPAAPPSTPNPVTGSTASGIARVVSWILGQ